MDTKNKIMEPKNNTMDKNNNKVLIIVLVVILVAGLGFTLWQVFRGQDTKKTVSESDQGVVEDVSYTNPTADYTIIYPSSWTAQEAYSNITVLGKDIGQPVPSTIVLGVSSLTEVNAETPDEWFIANGLENNPAIEVEIKEEMNVNGTTMTYVIQNDTANQTKVAHYVYFSDDGKVVILSHAPYVDGSLEANDFYNIVQSLVIN